MKTKIALTLALALAAAVPALAQQTAMPMKSSPMSMPMSEGPSNFAPTRQAYTTNHQLLIRLLALPSPIPYQKYFTLRFAVYDPQHPNTPLPNAHLSVYAGMRHGLKTGFAHGMNSSPQIADHNGIFTITGMYFHMMGPWTLQMTASNGTQQGEAFFQLPCCGQ